MNQATGNTHTHTHMLLLAQWMGGRLSECVVVESKARVIMLCSIVFDPSAHTPFDPRIGPQLGGLSARLFAARYGSVKLIAPKFCQRQRQRQRRGQPPPPPPSPALDAHTNYLDGINDNKHDKHDKHDNDDGHDDDLGFFSSPALGPWSFWEYLQRCCDEPRSVGVDQPTTQV